MTDCPFCNPDDILLENDLAFAKYDLYPVSPGHVLVVPKRHTASWFDLTAEEQTAMFVLANQAKKLLDERYAPAGYNLGINCGEAAGQTIMHVHLHIIPRYCGDVPNPRGGIRAVIAAKQDYTHWV
ncbi:MAG TPA: HIT family protein [Methanocorpusculum sp.]|nr:HIT family protein [Methanocorpusculum sp.]HJK25830.1 HIT family protein [Methanocorpusculum sp.]HJK26093.1 HIT family protein [Methanocorpusculum sp.]HJK28695.1 HIT family protein [Methanocorpusculum sp.]HJK30247.1 HIT family protein [Methanocorpusculum sp.]